MKFCQSCAMPLMSDDGKELPGIYCQYCSDENGNLRPKQQVIEGTAGWLMSWAPDKENVDFKKRAEAYLSAMPAWAEK